MRAIQVEIARVDVGDLAGGTQRLGDVAQHHRHRRLGVVEGRRAGEQLVGDAADRVEVRPRTDVARHRLLGRHVGGRPDRRAGGGHVRARARLLRRLGDPEVGDLDAAVVGHHQVLGLEVAVDDRALLGRAEPGEDAVEHAADLRRRHRADVRPQRPALHPLHRDVRGALVLEVVEHGDDVGVRQRAGEPRLAHEAAGDRRLGGVERRHLLERDVAVEVELAREEDDPHPAAPDLAQDAVATDGADEFLRHCATLQAFTCPLPAFRPWPSARGRSRR